MVKTTQAELDGALRRCARAAEACGLDSTGWALHGGSASNGITFKLATPSRLIHLGMTQTDAWRSLLSMAEAFEMVKAKR